MGTGQAVERSGTCPTCCQPLTSAHGQVTECLEALLLKANKAARIARRLQRQLVLIEAQLHAGEGSPAAGTMEHLLQLVEDATDMAAKLAGPRR
jgi:hypothetical protein